MENFKELWQFESKAMALPEIRGFIEKKFSLNNLTVCY
jgi:hypothetical protein